MVTARTWDDDVRDWQRRSAEAKRPRSKGNLGKAELAQEIAGQIRNDNPKLSETEIFRRANAAAGLRRSGEPVTQDRSERIRSAAAARTKETGTAIRSFATTTQARRTIFGVMVISIIIGIIRDVSKGRAVTTDVLPRRLVGAFVATFFLMLVAGPAPRVAKGLAVLVGLTVVAFNVETVELIGKRVNAPATEGVSAPPASGGGSSGRIV